MPPESTRPRSKTSDWSFFVSSVPTPMPETAVRYSSAFFRTSAGVASFSMSSVRCARASSGGPGSPRRAPRAHPGGRPRGLRRGRSRERSHGSDQVEVHSCSRHKGEKTMGLLWPRSDENEAWEKSCGAFEHSYYAENAKNRRLLARRLRRSVSGRKKVAPGHNRDDQPEPGSIPKIHK